MPNDSTTSSSGSWPTTTNTTTTGSASIRKALGTRHEGWPGERKWPSASDSPMTLSTSPHSWHGFPKPRPYCPAIYVGTWVQVEPVADSVLTWKLEHDGSFTTNDPRLAKHVRWHARHRDIKDDRKHWIVLFDPLDHHEDFLVNEWSATTLRTTDLYDKERRFTRA